MQTLARFLAPCFIGAVVLTCSQAVPTQAAPAKSAKTVANIKAKLDRKAGVLYFTYRGAIVHQMAEEIERTFNKYSDVTHQIVLDIDSQGGVIDAGERVIHLLKRIKKTHRLATAVQPGRTCASMCVPIYLQGKNRFAARSSLWLFHDAAKQSKMGRLTLDREETVRIYQRYFVPAGVSVKWLNAVLKATKQSNLWQTGQDLVTANTGIVTQIIGNQQERNVETRKQPGRHTEASGSFQPRMMQ